MKFRLLAASIALIMTQAGFAANLYPRPERCPTIAELESAGISDAYIADVGGPGGDENAAWVGVERNNYFGTKTKWTFDIFLGIFSQYTTKNKVLIKANTFISDLDTVGKLSIAPGGVWLCRYTSSKNADLEAMAIYPSDTLPELALARKHKQ